ncbi:ABC transporter ATP-binding protein [Cellulomonas endometrii]|uniref:ABC transporter ATP-binding protein n=1 Tax=Cellulomonas endometrii TaxID=3036301 RepID=UPI0024AE7E91|nr:ATP-binding cassette domain-containing protein [Cellulomonas endometrii]
MDDVDLSIRRGESVAVTGPSGSGKTTLLAMLGGLVTPSTGFAGVVDDVGGRVPPTGHVAFVLQTVNALPRRSALENVALGALHDGVPWETALRLAREQLLQVGLGHLEGRAARSLSGGELQRVVLARALVGVYPFVLADEPTGQLDRSTTLDVVETMLASTRDRGLVIVTHDEEVASLCDRSLRLNDGRLEL